MAEETKGNKSVGIGPGMENTDLKTGLTDEQVKDSRARFGKNVLSPPIRIPLWQQFLEKFKDPTIILLCFAAAVSILIGVFKGHYVEGIGIIIAIILATGVSFYSEYKSNREFDLLNTISKERAKVRRNQQFHTIPVEDLVVGDIVYLEMGDKVPADGRVVKTIGLCSNQSLLTGESNPVKKHIDPEEGRGKSAYPVNMVYRGSTITDGSGIFTVTAVGDNTEMGKIAASLTAENGIQTPLQKRLEDLSKQIGYVGATVAVFIFFSLLAKNFIVGNLTGFDLKTFNEVVQYFMVAVTIIVVAVPEGLPMMVTMSLAFNMRKLAKANCLVKKLEASETVGSVTVICTDKTGTLTRNEMKPVWFYLGNNVIKRDSIGDHLNSAEWESIMLNSSINSTAQLEFNGKGTFHPVGNVTEGALLGLLYELGVEYWSLRDKTKIVKQIPFSSERKKMVTIVENGKGHICYEKGAPNILLDECGYIMINGDKVPLEKHRKKIEEALEEAYGSSYRVLAFVQKNIPCGDTECKPSKDGILAGLVGIADPLRAHVSESIDACRDAGIEVKMVTGDDLKTAVAIARECKILRDEEDIAIGHDDLEKMEEEELKEKIGRIKVLARSRPIDKLRLVKSLHAKGEVIGMTGDGINDAPAMNQADVGISMGRSGTEVAKEASDIVLLDDNFKSIVSGILWGRTIYENIQRLIQFQLTVNFVALAVAFLGPFLGINLPLTVVQLLWVNIIMDTFAALALSSEPPRHDTMQKKPRPRNEHIITPYMAGFILVTGLFMTTVLIILLKTGFLGGENQAEQLTILFTTFVMFQFWNEFNCRSLNYSQSPFEGLLKNKMFIVIVSLIFVIQILVVNFGGELFRTVPISLESWIRITLLTALVLPVGHLAKIITYNFIDKDRKKEKLRA